jgi:hypothetical protein
MMIMMAFAMQLRLMVAGCQGRVQQQQQIFNFQNKRDFSISMPHIFPISSRCDFRFYPPFIFLLELPSPSLENFSQRTGGIDCN